jgi:hypothetical protein
MEINGSFPVSLLYFRRNNLSPAFSLVFFLKSKDGEKEKELGLL